jgi:hypothetical protein
MASRKKRRIMDICSAIMEALPEEGFKAKTRIAEEVGTKEGTVERLLTIMKWAQEQPRIESTKVGERRYVWGKRSEEVAQDKGSNHLRR